jgi:hypothetical protein
MIQRREDVCDDLANIFIFLHSDVSTDICISVCKNKYFLSTEVSHLVVRPWPFVCMLVYCLNPGVGSL